MDGQGSQKQGTSTSSFGVSRRENHDSSLFYSRFITPELSDSTDIAQANNIDRLFYKDARSMTEVEDNSVALVITSPPYFAGKEYESILGQGGTPDSYTAYLEMLEEVFAECIRKLEPGGRIAINVANLGRKPYRSLSSDITSILQDRLKLLLRGEVIWLKAKGAGGSCAWGSFQKPANPVLRDLSERIIIASKGRFDRALSSQKRSETGLPSQASIFRDEFMEATTDIWEIPPESARRVNHPAPFPVELPERLIHLYTYENDLILDPFMGSGTCAIAAMRTGRHFIGYDTHQEYVSQAQIRIEKEQDLVLNSSLSKNKIQNSTKPADPRIVAPHEVFHLESIQERKSARQIAKQAIEQCGFEDIKSNVKLPEGIEVDFIAQDKKKNMWYFEVSGGFTSSRPGLNRSEVFWKALGKSAVLSQSYPQIPLIILTPNRPSQKGSADKALKTVTGVTKPIRDVITMTSCEDLNRLKEYGSGS